MNNITTIESLALSKLTLKGNRPAVGLHHIDTTVRITGTINIAEDTEKVPTVSIPVKEVLALFIARAGITREASVTLLRSALTDALLAGSKGQGAIAGVTEIDQIFKDIVSDVTKSLPKTPVAGRVDTKLEVTKLPA